MAPCGDSQNHRERQGSKREKVQSWRWGEDCAPLVAKWKRLGANTNDASRSGRLLCSLRVRIDGARDGHSPH
jgi:hypothetical protein